MFNYIIFFIIYINNLKFVALFWHSFFKSIHFKINPLQEKENNYKILFLVYTCVF